MILASINSMMMLLKCRHDKAKDKTSRNRDSCRRSQIIIMSSGGREVSCITVCSELIFSEPEEGCDGGGGEQKMTKRVVEVSK